MRRFIHLITPGDHFSPRTGSAIPTVVHGLSAAAASTERPAVLVARGTYPERYTSAEALEYEPRQARRWEQRADVLLGRAGLPRTGARRVLSAALVDQDRWPASVVLAHNAPQAVPLVSARHAAVLYAHNQLFATYSSREAGHLVERTRCVVAVSQALADQLAARLPVSAQDRIRVVLNGVDPVMFAPDEAWHRRDRLLVVFVGRMVRDKGADLIVDAVRRLGRRDIDVLLVGGAGFTADGPLTAYEQHVRSLAGSVPGQVEVRRFVPRPQVPPLLRSADVVVVPSRWADPSPLTVLEGMASGAALVGARIGGIPELVGDAGLLVRPDDADDLAQALEHLADDNAALTAARAASRARAVEQSWSRVAERLSATLVDA